MSKRKRKTITKKKKGGKFQSIVRGLKQISENMKRGITSNG